MQPARVLRGGGWINNDDNDNNLQSAARGAVGVNDNDNDDDNNGFRAARTLVARVHRPMGGWSERGTVPPSSGPGA